MKKLLTVLLLILITTESFPCTNLLVSRGASKDGSVMVSYAADSHTRYGAYGCMGVGEGDPAGKHECALLEALMPGSIKLERLDMTDDWFAENAREMSVEAGREVIEAAIKKMCVALCPEKYGEE